MANFGFDDMQAIQKELQEKYYEQWGGLYPEKAARMLLWMFCEAKPPTSLKNWATRPSWKTPRPAATLSRKCAT